MTETEEAIVEYARTVARLYWANDQGYDGSMVTLAQRDVEDAADELARLGFNVPRQA